MTVFVSQSVGSRNKYHTKMCRNAKEIAETREVSKTEAQKMGLEECRICNRTAKTAVDTDWSYQKALKNND